MAYDSDSRQLGVNKVFIGAGCNRIVNNVSWGACDLVSFGAQNAVAIFCPKSAQILATLSGHKAFVNCTLWLPSNKFSFKAKHLERHYLLSGDVDEVISLWELSLVDKKGFYGLCCQRSRNRFSSLWGLSWKGEILRECTAEWW